MNDKTLDTIYRTLRAAELGELTDDEARRLVAIEAGKLDLPVPEVAW